MEEKLLPMQQALPLHVTEMIHWKGKSQYTWLIPATSQELPERCCRQRRPALGAPTPDFSSGSTPEAFPVNGHAAMQWRFQIRIFLPLALHKPMVSHKAVVLVTLSGGPNRVLTAGAR